MLAQVLIGDVVLVEQNFHAALPFALQPVGVTTLQTVCDTVRGGFDKATDEWTTVALLTEQLQNVEHHIPVTDDVVSCHCLCPRETGRKHQILVPVTVSLSLPLPDCVRGKSYGLHRWSMGAEADVLG
jgi:hypothetical protein